ncbi:NUDIX hydrolase [Pseudoduganella lutea]|uniref:NUDIX domain-containing protein n=1 Tax=Pseudoduganella lutea TaxID=321985 RepID=A0A4P6L5F3_9BURK|nr:NUDIX domain-containing protein [Pseudoduganella lutea]QBE66891.1 NUDIX domain-containing protein [Pseudoduganella lutea]
MISVDFPGHRFRLRAAGIVIDDGCVLLHRPVGDTVWALPGGRVEAGEEASACVAREFEEEIGEAVECGALLHVVENFFALGDRPYHEVGLYFDVTLRPGSALLDKARSHAGIEGERHLEFRWFSRSALDGLEIRPAALRDALAGDGPHPAHIVQRDRGS